MSTLPSLTLATVDTAPTENTGMLVERLWEASHDSLADVEAWHRAVPAAAPVDTNDARRWPWVIAALSLAVAVVAMWLLPSLAENQRRQEADQIRQAIASARLELNDTREIAATIVDPAADSTTLSSLAADLTRIDSAARQLLTQAVAADRAELDDARQIGQAGELALSLERRLSTVLTYRLLIESSARLPELPTATDDLGGLARSLSEAVTSLRADMASLPSDDLLSLHRQLALTTVDRLEADQARYLSAVRDENAEAAAQIAAEMESALEELDVALDEILIQLASWVTETVDAIDANLDA